MTILDGEDEEMVLAANRQGKLTAGQLTRYRRQLESRWRQNAIVMSIAAAVTAGILVLSAHHQLVMRRGRGLAAVGWLALAAALVAGVSIAMAIRKSGLRQLAAIEEHAIEVVSGTLTSVRYHTRLQQAQHAAAYNAYIGGRRLYCEGDVGRRVVHFKGKAVRAYCLPRVSRIVSIEPAS